MRLSDLMTSYKRRTGAWRQQRGAAWYLYVAVLLLVFGGIGEISINIIDRKSYAVGTVVAIAAGVLALLIYGFVFYRAIKRRRGR